MSKGLRAVIGVVITVAGVMTGNAQLALLGASMALGAVLEEKPLSTRRLQEQTVMVRSAVKPQEIVYGRCKKSGVVAYYGTSGNQSQYLWFVIAVAEHEIDGYESLWIEDTEIDIATEIDVDGYVTNSAFVDADGNYLVKTKFYTGLDSQTADAELEAAFTDWTTDHKGEGVAYFWVRCELDRSAGGTNPENPEANVWHEGWPQDIAVTLRGKKVYDPRLDSTNGGSGTHRVDTESTWTWSENSVLCRTDYLRSSRFGPGFLSSEVAWSVVSAEADICDALVSIPGSQTQKRYTLNGVVSTEDTPKTIIGSMQSADHGTTLFLPSGIEVRAGAWDASAHTIDETWLAGAASITSAKPMDSNYNAVRGQFMSVDDAYAIKEFQPRTASAYETEDGIGRVWQDIILPFTTEEYTAQRLAIIELKKSRQQKKVRLMLNFRGELVKLWDVVTVNVAGISGDTFRVIGKTSSIDGTINLELREEVSSDWTYTVPQLATPPIIPSIVRNPSGVPAPTGLTATSGPGGVYLNWSMPNLSEISHVEVYVADTNDRTGAALADGGRVTAESFFYAFTPGVTKYFWVIARGKNNMLSDWEPTDSLDGVPGLSGSEAGSSIIGYLSDSSSLVAADADGTGYSLAGEGGTFHVWEGSTDKTGAGPTYSIVGGTDDGATWSKVQNGLTMTMNETSGVYSLSGASWTSDSEKFTLRAVYSGVTIDLVYTITKSKAGADGSPAKLITIDATARSFSYDGSGTLTSANEIDFTATQSGSTETVNWKTQRWSGTAWVDTTINRVSPTTGLTTTLTESAFDAESEITLRVVASFTDGSTYEDSMSIVKIQDGQAGLSIAELAIYRRRSSAPSTPSGGSYNFTTQTLTPPTFWTSAIPSGDDPIYTCRGVAAIEGQTGIDSSISWSSPVLMAKDGTSVDIVFKRSATQPSTPSPSSGTPSGWYTDVGSVPAGSDPIWSSVGTRDNPGENWTWQTPLAVEGQDGADGSDGADGLSSTLTNPVPQVDSNFDGSGYSLVGTGGTHQVISGSSDVTTSSTHSIVGGTDNGSTWSKTQNGLTLTVNETTGVYSFSGASWTTNQEQFTLRATYNSVDLDKIITITKVLGFGDGGCQLNSLSNQNPTDFDSVSASARYQLDEDGDIYITKSPSYAFTSVETWIGGCNLADYECKMVKVSGSTPSGPTLGSWHSCDIDRLWTLSRSSIGTSSAQCTFSIRRATDDVVLKTVIVNFTATREP